jgi:hypothetical protein
MAFSNSGGLFGASPEPAKNQEETAEQKLIRAEERNKALEAQLKTQRDSFLQLSQHSSQQTQLLRDQLQRQVTQQHPAAIPSAQSAPASDKWEDIVNTIAGGGQPAQGQPAAAPISREVLRQEIRQTIQQEEQQAAALIHQENQELQNLVNTFRVQNPELAQSPHFSKEVDRAYAGLRRQGLPVQIAWNTALQEAAHITTNYAPRRAKKEEDKQPTPQIMPGMQYAFPVGGAMGAAPKGQEIAFDMRPPEERFKEASTQLNQTQLEAAKRAFGF